ncbi:MAG TPA: HNH endonuclease domain-containing protein, partial [Chitinophagales bacterium]|nr:HNH endonuclease domain-containing protein [Chitinophagales bacterium]
SVMGDDWRTKTYTYKTTNGKGQAVQRNADYKDLWHVLFAFEDEKKLKDFATEKLGLDEPTAKKFVKIPLRQGYANLSLKAINRILPWLKKGLIYSHAVFMANIDKVVDKEISDKPEDLEMIEKEIGRIIDNHTDETRKVNAINALIKTYRDDSKEAEPNFKADLENKIKADLENKMKAIYGEKTWNEKNDKGTLLSDAFELLKKQLKKIDSKDAFAKVKRIDDRVTEFLLGNNLVSDEARLQNLYHPSDLEGFQPETLKDTNGNPVIINGKELKLLPLPKTASIKNPVLMRAMHQLRRLINQLLRDGVIDATTRIHIELAREVNDANKRAAWKAWQDTLRDKRENAVKEIKKLYKAECGKDVEPTEDDITRYLLWEEQGKREIYERECSNISICDIIGADPKYDIEHTIPRSISWDNSTMNKTLCSKKFNREIKKNKTPFELDNHEEILKRIEPWKKKYEELDAEIKKINASRVTDKAVKDKLIQKRHLLKFEYDYWKGKYDRFVMEEVTEGFKNSQIVDTGLITRFAKNYLSCLFRTPSDNSNVMAVNGQTVAEFRKAWGLQEEYIKKSRASHIHHCIDAVTVACMTKDKYDAFVEQWRKAEEEGKRDVKTKIKIPKPWETFTEDIKKLEDEILVVYANRDNVPKQSFRKMRQRGKIVYKEMSSLPEYMKHKKEGKDYFTIKREGKTFYKVPKFMKGDTVRGSLHQDTFYGAIKPLGEKDIQYVVRKKLADLSDADLDKIIDDKVKEVAKAGRVEEKKLKKEIEALKKKLKNAEGETEKELKTKIQDIQNKIDNELYLIPPKKGKTQFTPIRKVRIKAHVSEPLPDFKQHRDVKKNPDGSEKHPYKKWIYVQNDENYGLALYENEDRTKRAAQIVKMIDAAAYFKASSKEHRKEHPLVPEKKGMKIKGLLKPGTLVLFYKEHPEELWELSKEDLKNRLYFVRKTSKNGQTTFQFHQEARNDEQLKEDYRKQHGTEPPKSLTNGEGSIDFSRLPIPKLLLSPVNMTMLIEGVDFKISPTGKIEKIEKQQPPQVK